MCFSPEEFEIQTLEVVVDMPKNPNHKSKPVKRDEPMTGAMKFFIAGLVAELYLLILRRGYTGSAETMIAWYDRLPVLAAAGGVVLLLGVVLSVLWRADRKKRPAAWALAGGGAFLGAASGLVRLWNLPALTFLCVLVPVVVLMGILWLLYDRECACALTILGVSLMVLWVCRRLVDSMYLGTAVRVGAVVYLALLAAAAFLARKADRSGGRLGKVQVLPANADVMPVYVACGLSAAALVVALFSATAAFYAMWALALVVFALAVYYTVKQL